MILVTTAGKIGAEASRLLAQRGAPVRVLVRNPEKVTGLVHAGVDVCQGDLEVPATIDAAMQNVTSVVLVSPAIPRQELNVIASAVRARVQHVVKIMSKASADSPIARRRGLRRNRGNAASPTAHAGKTYWPTGPEVLAAKEVAAIFSRV